jgi:hypothetical protein
MKPVIYVGMAGLAGVLALVMAMRGESGGGSRAAAGSERAFLPALAARINDVAALRVEHGGEAFSITRGQENWGMAEKGGYPVDVSKVRQLLIALGDAEVLEEKTATPELYERLGVQDPDDSEESSTRLTLLDDSGSELASLIVGQERDSGGGAGRPGASRSSEAFYVRRSGEAVSWLVSGKLDVQSDAQAWLDKTILSVDRDRMRAARIEHGDGEVVFASKSSKDATNFKLADIPEGREPRYEGVANSFGSSLSNLSLDDVLPAEGFEFSEPLTARVTFWTFDGLRVGVEIEEREEKLYARFDAAYDETGPSAPGALGPPVPVESVDAGEDEAGHEDAGSEEATPEEAETGPSPDEVRAEVAQINDKVAPWIYVLPSWKKSSFVKRTAEMLKEPPSEEDDEDLLLPEGFEEDSGGDALEDLLRGLEDETSGQEDPVEDSVEEVVEEVVEELPQDEGDEQPEVVPPDEVEDDSEAGGDPNEPLDSDGGRRN